MKNNLFILLLLSAECRPSRRAVFVDLAQAPALICLQRSFCPCHRFLQALRHSCLHHRSRAEPKNKRRLAASPPVPTFPSPAATAAVKPEIITVHSRHVHANALASTAPERLVYSIHQTPFLMTGHAGAESLTLCGHCKCVYREAGISRLIFLLYLKGKSNKTSQQISISRPGSRLVHSFVKYLKVPL